VCVTLTGCTAVDNFLSSGKAVFFFTFITFRNIRFSAFFLLITSSELYICFIFQYMKDGNSVRSDVWEHNKGETHCCAVAFWLCYAKDIRVTWFDIQQEQAIYISQRVKTGSGFRRQGGRGVKLTSHLYLMPILKSGYNSTPSYNFIERIWRTYIYACC
jgi:hypothetical protein